MSEDLRLYTSAMVAYKYQPGNVVVQSGAAYVLARNKDEALGKSLHRAYEEFPESAGWRGHTAAVDELAFSHANAIKAALHTIASTIEQMASETVRQKLLESLRQDLDWLGRMLDKPQATGPSARRLAAPSHKICRRCGRIWPINQFRLHGLTKDGYTHVCEWCLSGEEKPDAETETQS